MKSKQVQEFKETEIGKIPVDWEIHPLGNFISVLGDYHSNGSYKKLRDNVTLFTEKNYALMIRTTNFEQNDFSYNLRFIDKHAYDFLAKSKVIPFDIIMNKIANAGSVYLMPDLKKPVSLGMNQFLLRIKHIDQKFVYYFLKYKEDYVKSFAQGSVTLTITKDNVRKLFIAFPKSVDEQKSISDIFYNLEIYIKNLQNQNRTLEQTAQAIFKSWFVDFDGVTTFEDSKIGKIPKGWEVNKLENILELTKGVSYKSKELMPSNKALVTLKSINRGGGYAERGLKSFDGKYNDDQIVYPNDIVIAQTTVTQNGDVIGKPAMIRDSKEFDVLIASLDLLIARTKNNNIPNTYLYYLLMTDKFQNHIYGYTNGSVVLHLSKDGVPNFQFVLPPKKNLEQFNKLVSRIIQKKYLNYDEIDNLTKTRDILLPKLMSGKIRV